MGAGQLIYDSASPAGLTHQAHGGDLVRALARRATTAAQVDYRETSHLVLRRGPYVVAAGLDESSGDPPLILRGHFLDLFDPDLPVLTEIDLTPGSRRLLYDLDQARSNQVPRVLAGATKVFDVASVPGQFSFRAVGPTNTWAVVRIALPSAPRSVAIDAKAGAPGADLGLVSRWDEGTKTQWIRFPNDPAGHLIRLE